MADLAKSVFPVKSNNEFSMEDFFKSIECQLGSCCTKVEYKTCSDGHSCFCAENLIPFFFDNDSNEDRIQYLGREIASLLPKGTTVNQNGVYITQNGFEDDLYDNSEAEESSSYEPLIFKPGSQWELEDIEKVKPSDLDIKSSKLPNAAKKALEERVSFGKYPLGFEGELSIVDEDELSKERLDSWESLSTLKNFISDYCKSRGMECLVKRYGAFFQGADPSKIKNLELGDIKGYSILLSGSKDNQLFLMNMYLDFMDKRLMIDAFDCSKEIQY